MTEMLHLLDKVQSYGVFYLGIVRSNTLDRMEIEKNNE